MARRCGWQYSVHCHLAAGRQAIQGDAVDSDFWDKLVLSQSVRLVLLAMPGHAGNVFALKQLKHRAFGGRIAAIVRYPEEITMLRGLGADDVFHLFDEAGTAFADDALARLQAARPSGAGVAVVSGQAFSK